MNTLYRYSIFLLAISFGSLSTHASPTDPRLGIIHGQKTVPADKFKKNSQRYQQRGRVLTPPWMVSLQGEQFSYLFGKRFGKRYSHFCGGTLIAPQWVLTAAHCLALREPSKTRIKVGASHLYDTEEHLKVSSFRPHLGYDRYGTMGHHDIALIKLHKPILNAQCVKLPDTVDALNNIKHYSKMDTYGYGRTQHYSHSISSRLRHVLLPFNRDWEGEPDKTFRAGGDGYHATSKGDSGGPVLYNGVQYGITSWGYNVLEKGLYGSYTNVGYYLDWIQDVIHEEHTLE